MCVFSETVTARVVQTAGPGQTPAEDQVCVFNVAAFKSIYDKDCRHFLQNVV